MHFYASSVFQQILRSEMFDLANIAQGYEAQQSQWFHSMTNSVIFMMAHDQDYSRYVLFFRWTANKYSFVFKLTSQNCVYFFVDEPVIKCPCRVNYLHS